MRWERTSIVLELISFFLVTLDLFGEGRIELLQKRISRFSERWRFLSIVELFTTETITSGSRRAYFAYFQALFTFAVALGAAVKSAQFLGGSLPLDGVWRVAAMVPIAVAAFIPLIPLTWIPTLILILVLAAFIDRTLRAVLWLFKRYNLGGSMLIAGSLLFVTSKTISFVLTL
jgi:hypothetical protein